MKPWEELVWRGLVDNFTSPEVARLLDEEQIPFYCGFDPTASSLHVGSLLPLVTMLRLQRRGHTPIVLLGGATAAIGDPSFKAQERKLLSEDVIAENLVALQAFMTNFFGDVKVVNNLDWFRPVSILDFLREVGKHFSVNRMLASDSVKERLTAREQGISFTEFSYQLLQAQDFRELFRSHGCRLQLGGSDQWNNILGGMDLVRRTESAEVFGLTLPLLTKADGTKFGKTEAGNVWLNPTLTSPFDFFQFWIRTEDQEVVGLLKKLTFLSPEEINLLAEATKTNPERREAQWTLARELTKLVHGEAVMMEVVTKAEALFSQKNQGELTPDVVLSPEEWCSKTLVELVVELKLSTSKSMARKEIAGRAFALNGVKVEQVERRLLPEDVVAGRVLVSKGKNKGRIVEVK